MSVASESIEIVRLKAHGVGCVGILPGIHWRIERRDHHDGEAWWYTGDVVAPDEETAVLIHKAKPGRRFDEYRLIPQGGDNIVAHPYVGEAGEDAEWFEQLRTTLRQER